MPLLPQISRFGTLQNLVMEKQLCNGVNGVVLSFGNLLVGIVTTRDRATNTSGLSRRGWTVPAFRDANAL